MLYVTDIDNYRIQKFDLEGNYLSQWGTTASNGDPPSPLGIAVDKEGFVYVSDWKDETIKKYDGEGNFITSWGDKGDLRVKAPSSICVTSDGKVHVRVVDLPSFRVERFRRVEPHIPGDINEDGTVDVADAISIINYLFRGKVLAVEEAADVNRNGTINLADTIYILLYLYKGGTAPK